MSHRFQSVVLSVLFTAASIAGLAAAPIEEPRGLVDGFVRAWNAHDMKALADLFTEDADFVNVAGSWWKGRAQIQTMHERSHAAKFKDSLLVETNTTIRTLGPDVAVMHFKWELSGELDADGKPAATVRHGVMQVVAVKQAGGWRIVSAQNTNAKPPV